MRFLSKLFVLSLLLITVKQAAAFTLTSPDFPASGVIPQQYTCRGADLSPALAWRDVPKDTEAFAIIVRDPDASNKNWVHWVLYNLPLSSTGIPAGYDARAAGALVGANSWGRSTYQGPCPPTGRHHYRFELYALDQALYVTPDLTASQLEAAMQGHVLGMTSLTASYGK